MQFLPAAQAPGDDRDGATLQLTLTFDQRRKSRYRTRTDCGLELGWFLPRGEILADGDSLLCSDGTRVRVCAAAEDVSEVHCADAQLISRATYHLGNRHVPLDIARDRLRYQRDSVLDAMLVGLGLNVAHTKATFNPENGAYHAQGSHSHAQGSHRHAQGEHEPVHHDQHEHEHEHDHGHTHDGH
ncbi:MAG: urease accessory protein UreE [Chromatocurvus sp.]